MSYDLSIRSNTLGGSIGKESLVRFLREFPGLTPCSDSHFLLVDGDRVSFAEIDLVWKQGDSSLEPEEEVNWIEVHIPAAYFSQKLKSVLKVCARIGSHLGWGVFDEQEGTVLDLVNLL